MSCRFGRAIASVVLFVVTAPGCAARRAPVAEAPVPSADAAVVPLPSTVEAAASDASYAEVQPAAFNAPAESAAGLVPIEAATLESPVVANELELGSYVHEVLSRNQSLQAMIAAWQAAAQKYPQAVALDDPMFLAMTAPASLSSNDVTPAYLLGASQKIPWCGKRSLRGQVAQAEASAASMDVADARLQLTQAAQLAFYDYYLVHRQLELTGANVRRLEEFRDTARKQYEAGLAVQQDVLQAEVELAEAERRRIELKRAQRTATARINTLVHQSPDCPVPPPPGQLSADGVPAPPELLRQIAVQRRPDLAAMGAKIQADSASLRLAYKEFYPDFEIMGRYDRFWQPTSTQGDLQGQVGVNMNVPVYLEKRRAAAREAMYKLRQQRAEYEQRIDDVHQEVEAAYAQVVEMQAIVELYSERTLPAAGRNVTSAKNDYVAGKGDFLRLITAQRQALLLQEKQQEAIAGYLSRLAELERVVGGPVPLESPEEPIAPGRR
jgi:outer membrane protein TolC